MQPSQPASRRWPWILLPGRLLLFILFQAVFAVGYALAGQTGAWDRSTAWWPVTVTLTNFVCLFLLLRLYRGEGRRYWDLFRLDRQHWKSDLLVLLGTLVITGPVAMLPNNMLATALYGDSSIPMLSLISPLPTVGVLVAVLLFPITQGLVELAFYFLYIMPRLSKQINPWLAYSLASFFLGIQHLAAPLRMEPSFLLWRGLMFLPFAFLIGALLKWRPRMLPYVAVVHALMDLATGIFYLFPA